MKMIRSVRALGGQEETQKKKKARWREREVAIISFPGNSARPLCRARALRFATASVSLVVVSLLATATT